ncbi:NADH-quinone oxidoreductase subunit A [Aliarcobacter cibarius]|jgi:NADH-quinone oxidoreductase subunit A|uniref:NADH-quinone oxidoreductase subunit n=1 Tax=Aliarcobacter cibarius TaxID=255507 RepID=A0A5J6RK80_9BACT|nr:NADH-quinone oxidoreductase subunit A [Aliarcobacter cibarius]QEZ89777.1 NADH:quinone oxidoreductase I, membrane subunit A [Aliarcobacter cibarius]QKJ27785.1 NADH:quinone oxidoreductase I, membrane subunit A [Aliarcobacter cibarius]TLT01063.1 NADH-quinone oxidoreductase subunit A [Aliarcobacter cibarius]TLT01160.1 NADH-quinone oxidoreductase subunit A [Aliarcobacter cibarius]TLT04955.1 NADH-quinone oxidoreductase subunit A [Aliarcobacter cibarius]
MSTELILASTIFIAIGVVLSLFFVSTKHIGPNNKDSIIKNSVYESGVTNPIGTTKIRFSIKFYLVAISFLLFDVELVYMFPWAINVVELGYMGLVKMFIFMGLLFAGLIYIYKKKALLWD